WLRAFHAMPKRKGVESRPADRASFIRSVERLAGYLAERIEDERFFAWTIAQISKAAYEILPNELPCGTKHGDFAMRNILVGADGRVTVLDTLAKWWVPVYTDIAYFLTALKTTRPQILTQGITFSSSRLAQFEQELLQGYYIMIANRI
ncbi:MAG: phosphotransferase, partial [Lysobacterales bacterium]